MAIEEHCDGRPVPSHVAIIMDGNGRWARARGLPRTLGHKAGVEAVRRAVRAAPELGVRHLTLYAFSSENWSRPPSEVRDLLGLLRNFIRRDLAELTSSGVRVRILGRRDDLQPEIRELIEGAEAKTAHNSRLMLNVAFNYGGRDEIVRGLQALIDAPDGPLRQGRKISCDDIDSVLDTAGQPDPDLVIRTSGEQRVSNFLLWQIAYSEFVFLDCMWPDFDKAHFIKALDLYAQRNRRYGGIEAVKDAAS